MTRYFYPYYKRNSIEFSIDFLMLDYFDIHDFHIGVQMSIFQTGLDIGMPCGFLRGVLGNRDPLKGMRWLPRIRHSGRGITILLVSKLTIFKTSF